MNLLLDTHTFLWFLRNDPRLSETAVERIEDRSTRCFLSLASVWEMVIKISIGKLALAQSLEEFLPFQLQINGLILLPVRVEHLYQVSNLTLHHKDPFDRLLIVQSLMEAMPLISADPVMDAYGIQRIW